MSKATGRASKVWTSTLINMDKKVSRPKFGNVNIHNSIITGPTLSCDIIRISRAATKQTTCWDCFIKFILIHFIRKLCSFLMIEHWNIVKVCSNKFHSVMVCHTFIVYKRSKIIKSQCTGGSPYKQYKTSFVLEDCHLVEPQLTIRSLSLPSHKDANNKTM